MSTCCNSKLTNAELISLKVSPFDDGISTIYNLKYDTRPSSQNQGEFLQSSNEYHLEVHRSEDCEGDHLIPYNKFNRDPFPLISSLKRNSPSPMKRKKFQLQKIRENQCCISWRQLIHQVIDSFAFRIIIILLIMIDSILIIIDVSSPAMTYQAHLYFDIISLVFSIFFFVEILLRIYSMG